MMFTPSTLSVPRGGSPRPGRVLAYAAGLGPRGVRRVRHGHAAKPRRGAASRTKLVASHLGKHSPTGGSMSSIVPNAGSPDPIDPGLPRPAGPAGAPDTPTPPASEPPRTRREAVAAAGVGTSASSGWSGALIVMGILSIVLGVL